MVCPFQISCFDVDHKLKPKTKKATNLDHVSVTCIGRLNGSQQKNASFLVDLCSYNNPEAQFLLARIAYEVKDIPKATLEGALRGRVHIFEINDRKAYNAVCLETTNRQTTIDIFQKYWKCYGGSWLIAVDCQDQDRFVTTCLQAEKKIISISEAHEQLALYSRLAAVTFDDDILDIITQTYNANQMRQLIAELASLHECSVKMLPT
jgi:hypothetical protein